MDTVLSTPLIAFILITLIGIHIGLFLLFRKAGEQGWKAFVPLLNYYTWTKLVGKHIGWFVAILIPILNFVVFLVIAVDLARAFGRDGFWDSIAAMMFPQFYFPWLGMQEDAIYQLDREEAPKGVVREWADAIAFAVIAATFIRMFFFEAYTIPTTSMEGSLLAGDFLFVSKFHYGSRVPNTPLAFPFAHHTLPWGGKAFSGAVELPYQRLPKLQKIKRNDIVVFNFPEGDTVYLPVQSNSYYAFSRKYAKSYGADWYNNAQVRRDIFNDYNGRTKIVKVKDGRPYIQYRPVDKRENYIKRCIAIPGDSLWISGDVLYVNGETAYKAPKVQVRYQISFTRPHSKEMLNEFVKDNKLNIADIDPLTNEPYEAIFVYLSDVNKDKVLSDPRIGDSELYQHLPDNPTNYFPNLRSLPQGVADYGPITVPRKGQTVTLTKSNLPYYRRIITEYEGNADWLEEKIKNKEKATYTFEMDYYFMMGDNRHRSQDSRFWGFVPEDHVVGKAWFVWFSWDVNKKFPSKLTSIRTSRIFMPIHTGKWE